MGRSVLAAAFGVDLKTGPFDFAQLFAQLAERRRPFNEKMANIQQRFNDWWQRERARPGVVVTGGAPPEVDNKVAEQAWQRRKSSVAFYQEHAPAIRAEGERLVSEAAQTYTTLVAQMDQLRVFDQQHRRLAAACDHPVPATLAPENISDFELRGFQARAAAILRAPVAQPEPERNPLMLD